MRTVDIDGPFLKIKFTAPQSTQFYALLEQVKKLDGRIFEPKTKCWTAPICKDNIEMLKNAGFEFSPAASIEAEKYEENSEEIPLPEKVFAELTRDQLRNLDTERLRPFQIEGIQFTQGRNGNALIADQMGLGKTCQAIGYLAVNPELRPALVVCPASLKLNWVNEIRKWGLGCERIQILSGRKPDGLFRSDIFIINYDILGYNQIIDEEQEIVGWYETLSEIDLKVIISDECQMVSSHKAIRTKAFKRLAKTVPHKIFLSGTPIKNCPAEFFTVLNLLDKKSFPNRWQYLNRYCGPDSNGYSTTFKGLSNEKELYRLIYPLMIRREKKDVLKELPPKQKIVVPMECDPVQLRFYEQANSEFKEWVKEAQKSLSIKEHIEGLKQLAYMAKRNAVIKWIKDFLTSGEKLVVGAWHTRVLDDLEKEFGNISVRMDGSTPTNKRQDIVNKFQNEDDIRLFIGNIKVAGVGHTLTAANSTCTIELLWGPGDHDQFEDRVHRLGQGADSVLAYYLIAPDTVEEDIIDIIQEKAKMLGQVLDGESREFVEDNMLKELLNKMKGKNK